MATKRSKRIDPNEAFAAIVGSTKVDEETALQPSSVTANMDTDISSQPSPTPADEIFAAPVPETQKIVAEPSSSQSAHEILEASKNDIATEKNDDVMVIEAPRLVQKGYYITEEQHKKLGFYAVLQGTDRSAIVRNALNMYFEANKNVM